MDDLLMISGRTILTLIVLFLITKLNGKKQVSQLNLFDYAVGITIGSIAADISLDLEKDLFAGIFSLFLYGFIAFIISVISIKSMKARRIFNGVPTLLVENGKIIESGLKKSRIDINEFLSEARIAGYFDLNEINYAIMEINGSISFLPKEKEKPSTKKDVKVKCEENGLTANVVIDGEFMENNIKSINKDEKWLLHELKVLGYNDYSNILLATVDNNYQIKVYDKGVKPDKNTILE